MEGNKRRGKVGKKGRWKGTRGKMEGNKGKMEGKMEGKEGNRRGSGWWLVKGEREGGAVGEQGDEAEW